MNNPQTQIGIWLTIITLLLGAYTAFFGVVFCNWEMIVGGVMVAAGLMLKLKRNGHI